MKDFFNIDAQFSAEEILVRDSVRRFVNEKTLALMPEANEKAHFPKELIPELANLGVLGMTIPTEYGGAGASAIAYGLACQELERGDSALRSFVSVQSSLCMYPIFAYGTEEQKKRFLPKMSAGEVVACFGLTEPDSGSDPSSMKTTANLKGKDWIINGSKMWITNAPFADIAIIWAKTDSGIQGFIVERGFKGFETRETKHKFSLRASATGEIILKDVIVPESNRLPGTEKGLSTALKCLNQARFGIAWGVIGAAMACYECALDYVTQRKQFSHPIGSYQLVQKDLVDMLNEIVKAQCLNLQLARLKQENKITPEMISLAKMNNCREALNIARMARNLLGASGISLEYPVIRHMVNLESVFTYEGTDNIHHLIIGKAITGMSAF